MPDVTIDELIEATHELRLRARHQQEDMDKLGADLRLFEPIIDAAYEWHSLTARILEVRDPDTIHELNRERNEVLDRLFEAVQAKKESEE